MINRSPILASGRVSPTSKFTSWLGQAQYVRRIHDDWEAVIRSDLQLSNHPLFPIEQFPLGGIDTVRGYREYLMTELQGVGAGVDVPYELLRGHPTAARCFRLRRRALRRAG